MRRKNRLLLFALMTGICGSEMYGQSNTYLYRFDTSDTSSAFTTTSQLRYDVRPHSRTEMMFFGQNSNERWTSLVTSGYIMGGHKSTLTRGVDFMEDYHINFVDPSTPTTNYYGEFYINRATGTISESGWPRVLKNVGPQAGQSLLNNNNLIAMGDDNSLWYDLDGTLSLYNFPGGTLQQDYTWTTFSNGGVWNGLALASKLNLFIGYEESNLYFLEGDSTVHRFNLDGQWENTYQVTLDGALAGRTLGDLVDGKIDGYTYLGWDVGPIVIGLDIDLAPIPESSSMAFATGLFGLLYGVVSRRKRK